jgi:hypothetical protein
MRRQYRRHDAVREAPQEPHREAPRLSRRRAADGRSPRAPDPRWYSLSSCSCHGYTTIMPRNEPAPRLKPLAAYFHRSICRLAYSTQASVRLGHIRDTFYLLYSPRPRANPHLVGLSTRQERFELPTFGSVDRRSIQLSYWRRTPSLLPGSRGGRSGSSPKWDLTTRPRLAASCRAAPATTGQRRRTASRSSAASRLGR